MHLIDEWRLLAEYEASRTKEVTVAREEAREIGAPSGSSFEAYAEDCERPVGPAVEEFHPEEAPFYFRARMKKSSSRCGPPRD